MGAFNSKVDIRLRKKAKLIPLRDKLEMLKLNIEETERYELLTTNQYLKHMMFVVDILDELTEEKQIDEQ